MCAQNQQEGACQPRFSAERPGASEMGACRCPQVPEEAAAVEARADLLGRTSENSGLRVGRHGGQRGKVYTCLGGTWKGKLGRDI